MIRQVGKAYGEEAHGLVQEASKSVSQAKLNFGVQLEYLSPPRSAPQELLRKQIDRLLIDEALDAFFGPAGRISGADLAESQRSHVTGRRSDGGGSMRALGGRGGGDYEHQGACCCVLTASNLSVSIYYLHICDCGTVSHSKGATYQSYREKPVIHNNHAAAYFNPSIVPHSGSMLATSLMDIARRRVECMPTDLSQEAKK